MAELVIRIEVGTDPNTEDPHDVADELLRGGMALVEHGSGSGAGWTRNVIDYAGCPTKVISAEWGES